MPLQIKERRLMKVQPFHQFLLLTNNKVTLISNKVIVTSSKATLTKRTHTTITEHSKALNKASRLVSRGKVSRDKTSKDRVSRDRVSRVDNPSNPNLKNKSQSGFGRL